MEYPPYGKIVPAFDSSGKLFSLLYSDGSKLVGNDLTEYDAFMTTKFGPQWEQSRGSLRLCQFDEANRPPEREEQKESGSGLNPNEFVSVWAYDPKGILVSIRDSKGREIFGEAIAEWDAMKREKIGLCWDANVSSLTGHRTMTFHWNMQDPPQGCA